MKNEYAEPIFEAREKITEVFLFDRCVFLWCGKFKNIYIRNVKIYCKICYLEKLFYKTLQCFENYNGQDCFFQTILKLKSFAKQKYGLRI